MFQRNNSTNRFVEACRQAGSYMSKHTASFHFARVVYFNSFAIVFSSSASDSGEESATVGS